MRRWMLTAVALLVAALPVAQLGAVDFGGRLRSQVDFSQDDDTRAQFKLGAWAAFEPALAGDATAQFLIEGTLLTVTDTYTIADLEYLRAGLVLPGTLGPRSVLGIEAGRYQLADATGLVIDHRIDGLQVILDAPWLTFRAAAGHSGLLLKDNATIRMSASDLADLLDDDTITASPRIVLLSEARFPELIGRNSLVTGGVVQFDRRSGDGDRIDTQYGYLGLDGIIARNLYYDAVGVIGGVQYRENAGDDARTGVAVAGLARLTHFSPVAPGAIVQLTTLYASGSDSTFDFYTPITQPDTGLLEVTALSDLFLASLDLSFQPLARRFGDGFPQLALGAYGAGVWNANVGTADSYRGSELGLRVTARPFSDLGGSVRLASFLPDDGEARFSGRIEISTSF
ncbi:MAG: hypothetical protein EA403_01120 [Spirochaetaceae bacterium]|nr:MAG: hypothetical protein EA403_01120 [Spirochaetaceae bacterium]